MKRRIVIAGRFTLTSPSEGIYLVEGTRRTGARISWYFGDALTARRVARQLREERAQRRHARTT